MTTKRKKPTVATRKPPTAALEQFVQAGPGGTEGARRDLGGSTTTYVRRRGEAAGTELRRVTLYLPTDLHRAAAHAAVDAGVPLSEWVTKLLRKHLKLGE